MIPPSLFAIHWRDRRQPQYEGMVREYTCVSPLTWLTRAEAEHYIALTHLDDAQECTVVEYRHEGGSHD